MWDASYGWSIWLTQGLTGNGWTADWPDDNYWVSAPTGNEIWVFQLIYDSALVLLSAVGVIWVVRTWRRAARFAATK
jgi:hypothetical protein